MDDKKYKILLFGTHVVGIIKSIEVEYCDIQICSYPEPNEYSKLSRLAEYDLVILDYKAFDGQDLKQQEVFDKQIYEALDSGTSFCFLHYNEQIPDFESDFEFKIYLNKQLGLRWAISAGIPKNNEYTAPYLTLKRQEFKVFGERWGSSRTLFTPSEESLSCDEMFAAGDDLSGFAYQFNAGKIIFLPCQRDYHREKDLENCLQTLIKSILNYLKKSETTLPNWAETPLFSSETTIYQELEVAKSRVTTLEKSLEPFQEAKYLPFLREYAFETAVPKFFKNSIGLSILRNDISKEDFWILDSKAEKQVICETKTYLRGFKKTGIYNLYTHRESNELDEDFPALLIVNAHTIANSWKEKIQALPPQDYKLAVTNNVLIMRIEDLLFFWNLMTEGKKTKNDLLSLILTEKGWLEVTKEGKIISHK